MPLEALRQRFSNLTRLLQSEEYFAVASDQRFRAVERRSSWQASRAAMLVVAIGAPIHIVVLSLFHPADAPYLALVDGILGAIALGAWWSLGGGLRHWPEPVAFVISLAVAGVSMLLAVTGPQLVELTIGYLLFLPTLAALVLPWRSWTELRWLAVYGIGVSIFFATCAPDGRLVPNDRRDLIFALLVALAGAFTGHVLLMRYRVRSFVQVQALRRLQHHERRQRVELERVYHALEVTARTDRLTGTYNRVKLDEDLRAARARLARTGASFGLLEVDLDRFKGINDAFGHLAGDEVLRQVGRTLREAVRSDDAVYRYGGEEFLIILGAVPGGVQKAGERIRRAIEDLGLPHPGNPPFAMVTVSVGAARIEPDDAEASNEDWFGRADTALYVAKSGGRNRVAVAPVSGSVGLPRQLNARSDPGLRRVARPERGRPAGVASIGAET